MHLALSSALTRAQLYHTAAVMVAAAAVVAAAAAAAAAAAVGHLSDWAIWQAWAVQLQHDLWLLHGSQQGWCLHHSEATL